MYSLRNKTKVLLMSTKKCMFSSTNKKISIFKQVNLVLTSDFDNLLVCGKVTKFDNSTTLLSLVIQEMQAF